MATITPVEVKTQAVIFDLDGVLVWTVPMHWWAFRKTFEAEGKEFSFDDYMKLGLGASRDEVIRRVLGELPQPKFEELMAKKERLVMEYLQREGVESIPGSVDFIKACRERKLKTAVASASRTPRLLLESNGTAWLFDVIVDRGMVKRSKPDPELFLLSAEKLGVPPEACLVIEDAPIGVEAALAAKMRVIALITTHEAKELSRATAVYSSFAAIPFEQWL